ncbi:MAG: hypothetical protein AUH77_10245 [Candidatus Rokubacteria bacterium 13_1_40CM_4_69_39]|nr:MAG: hypothetical protein AUH26_04435 [Candidatus Rokubacteria bacterium 13_1_40CM_69_96]OLC53385.1 MAG: hypothetical protein AUH77_10245 [Candidatus Rokubacteria bacterium 13_1_40CM_4_69_39]OLC91014.1 MAG: hypothetical protein AUJ05_10325 [Candidatus Rokubacteria bacterium 13_1_40CM_3_69_38]OLD27422.1 MAG: hypothetical protein AUI18_06830 [Candidatus Rokubacteria bacterium 13_1_40CM_2_70_45]OLD77527.1 MAG: hypothetical protein AUG87_04350 [Candidatus Rokubacteria bacterium 13_1_20CM_4_70_14
MDARSLAHAARRGGGAVIARALAGVLALWSVAAASVTDVRVDAYREAASAGAVGTVTGHAREERLKPGDVERPLLGTVVTLVPYSPALLARFEEIRTHARDSANAYRASGRAIRLAREAYEKALWEAGAPDFVRASVVDATGGFRMEDLPAGAWLLIATRSVVVDRASPRIAKRERETYAPALRLRGFSTVSVWVRELTVSAGRTEDVELMDRNVWFTGIEEERALDAGP